MFGYRIALGLLATLSASHLACAQATAETPLDCATASTPDQQHDAATIARIEQGWLTAEYRGNARFLDCLLEPDYRVSDREGKIRTRQDLLDRVQNVKDKTREIPKLESIVFVHGDSASAHSIMHTTDKAGNPKEVHFIDAYTFHDGRWYAYGGADF